jgi:hypothetical protein
MATDATASIGHRPRRAPRSMRSFDPRRIGAAECDVWVGYYLRRWPQVLTGAVRMVHAGFGMPWPRTLYGAWLVLRANQLWAPVPDNDPDGARRTMRRFYALAARTSGEPFDVDEAARLEVEWWRVHRHLQRDAPEEDQAALVDALAALYAHVYGGPPDAVRLAAAERAAACRISDGWVADGRDPASAALPAERAALVRSYAALLAAVHR